jgi:hypothetical protein|tara:strand:+ start:1969 stop:2151 length:183 start_codon:yes stop_codon:yes gene_type:complete
MKYFVLILVVINLSGCKTLAPEGTEAARVWENWKNPDGHFNKVLGFGFEVLGNSPDLFIK